MEQTEETYLSNLALRAVVGLPREDILYAIITHFLVLHQKPSHRFTIYPQMTLKWKPTDQSDQRAEIPDIGLGTFTLPGSSPLFKLRCGVEAKRAVEIMQQLPKPESILSEYDVVSAFYKLDLQAQNQAKAAYRNNYPLANDGIWWILLVGPYWIPSKYGPFSEAELSVRAHKPSDSGDFEETMKMLDAMDQSPPEITELYLLGTPKSYKQLEEIIASTDTLAQPFIDGYRAETFLESATLCEYNQ
ncbi:hypothetical protein V8E53_000757 [Lactarius tabidus]